MQKTCAKCGHINPWAAGDMTDACPRCGVIYAKVPPSTSAGDSGPAQPMPRPSPPPAARRPRANPPARFGSQDAPPPQGAGVVEKILWLWTMISGLTASGLLLYTFTQAQSAPQQGAGAAMAAAVVVVPYCLARAVQCYKR